MDLVCIPPSLVHELWPKVGPMLHAAVRKTNLAHSADLDEQVLRGDGLLWLAIEGQTIHAAATTVLQRTDRELVCIITTCAGDGIEHWIHLVEQIEDWARFEGAVRTRIIGRAGWLRVLNGYRQKHIIIEKAL